MRANRLPVLVTPGLSAQVWLLQVGVVVNFFGNGLVAPFLVIYLHSARGIPLGLAGLALASGGLLATSSGLLAGSLIDRFGARTCLAAAMSCNALAYAAYTQVHVGWQAVAVGAAVGIGTGAYGPCAQTLLGSLVRPEQRAAGLSQQRMSALAGLGLGGLAGGVIAAGGHPKDYVLLLILDSCPFAAFAGLTLLLPNPRPRRDRVAEGYRRVLADRRLRLLASLHFVTVSAGFAPMLVLLPAFASGQAHVPAAAIGLLYAINTVVILIVQLPITQLVARRRPLRRVRLVGAVWTVSWALVFTAGYLLHSWAAAGLLGLAMIVYALGECVHTATVIPSAAAIAPDALRGRYLAVMGFAWQAGFMVGPAAGGALLGRVPLALPIAAATVCAAVALLLPHLQRGFGMKWITRENAAVDRTACPWLIRRFVDPEAEFLFVPPSQVMETASASGAIPYDVPDVELGHRDGRCSFESIVHKYGLRDPALLRMATIIHGADIQGDDAAPPEAAGLVAIMHGLRLQLGLDDHRKLMVSSPIYDALYTYCGKA